MERSALALERNALELAQKALESKRKAQSKVDREVLTLRGWVMGTEEASARLCEQVARQAEEFSTLENFCLGMYLFLLFVALVSSFSLFLSLSPFFQSWVER